MIKKFLFVLVVLPTLLITLACDDALSSNQNTNKVSDQNVDSVDMQETSTKGRVLDSIGTMIGYLVAADYEGLTIFTEKNYMVRIHWTAEIINNGISFTDKDGGGKVIVNVNDDYNQYAKIVYYDDISNVVYVPKDINEDGTSQMNTNTITCYSYTGDNGYENVDSGFECFAYIELKKSTLENIGYVENITLPLKIVFNSDEN